MNEKSHGIQAFIDYKNDVENERPTLTTEPRLITVDGPDGVGKTSLTKALRDKLAQRYGEEMVIYADITNLRGSPGQERLRGIKSSHHFSGTRLDGFYAAGVNRAYAEVVIPALQAGKIVVVDRSEVDLLRYALEQSEADGDATQVTERERHLRAGSLTHRLWAGNRVFVTSSPEDIWENLNSRDYLSPYDPSDLAGVKKRMRYEEEAEQKITAMPSTSEVTVVRVGNPRLTGEEEDLSSHLEGMAEKILNQLNLPEIRA